MSQQINLYEARLRPRHELATGRNLGVCVLVLLLVIGLWSTWASVDATRKTEAATALQKQLSEEQEKLVALSKLVAQQQVSPALLAEIESVKATLATRNDVLVVLGSGNLGNTTGFFSVLAGFARQVQPDLWLTGFQVTRGGDEIEIRGRLLDPAKLPAYVQRLSGEQAFQGRRFATLEMRGVDPVEPPADQAHAPVAVGERTSAAPAALALPAFVEFVLRSENAGRPGRAETSARSGANP